MGFDYLNMSWPQKGRIIEGALYKYSFLPRTLPDWIKLDDVIIESNSVVEIFTVICFVFMQKIKKI